MAARRLSEADRAELECRPERLRFELKLIEGELRSDETLRVQAEARPEDERHRLAGRWRDWIE